jgi:hypothetical protein
MLLMPRRLARNSLVRKTEGRACHSDRRRLGANGLLSPRRKVLPAARSPDPDSMDFYFRARALMNRGSTAHTLSQRRLLKRALLLDLHNVDVLAAKGWIDTPASSPTIAPRVRGGGGDQGAIAGAQSALSRQRGEHALLASGGHRRTDPG